MPLQVSQAHRPSEYPLTCQTPLITVWPPLSQVLEEERDTDLEDSMELSGDSWQEEGLAVVGRHTVCQVLAPPLEPSGRETPASVDSIPLEWDHTGDVGGSSSPEDEDDVTFYSTLSGEPRGNAQSSRPRPRAAPSLGSHGLHRQTSPFFSCRCRNH